MSMTATRTAFRTCPLCEAGCGLEIGVAGRNGDETVTRIRGDRADVFSHGFICPKGSALKHLHEDPDWLRAPMVKRNGRFVAVTWDEAFAEIARRLAAVVDEHGRDATAVYVGNPNAHTLAGQLYIRPLIKALRTRNVYSASSVDQLCSRERRLSVGITTSERSGESTVIIRRKNRTRFARPLPRLTAHSSRSPCLPPCRHSFPRRSSS